MLGPFCWLPSGAGGPGGSRDPVDFQTYRRTQTALAKSLSVVKAALARPEADKLLKEHKQDADKAPRNSEGDHGRQRPPGMAVTNLARHSAMAQRRGIGGLCQCRDAGVGG